MLHKRKRHQKGVFFCEIKRSIFEKKKHINITINFNQPCSFFNSSKKIAIFLNEMIIFEVQIKKRLIFDLNCGIIVITIKNRGEIYAV